MSKENKNELDFESLLSSLESNTDSIVKGNYRFTELTMKEQRKILNVGFSPIEIPAQMENIFNDYIKVGVSNIDNMVDILEEVTVDLKPFLIIQLRCLTLGNVYVDRRTNIKWNLYDVQPNDLESTVEPKIIKFNDFIIRLSAPTLKKDTSINNQLIVALGSFKKNLSDEDYGKVADLYEMYELMKYITEIELNGNIFNFEQCPVNKKHKILNSLPQKVVAEINEYIEEVKGGESKALTMVNPETNETKKADMNTIFFVRSARDK